MIALCAVFTRRVGGILIRFEIYVRLHAFAHITGLYTCVAGTRRFVVVKLKCSVTCVQLVYAHAGEQTRDFLVHVHTQTHTQMQREQRRAGDMKL